MDAKLIENMDRRRYTAWLLQTAGAFIIGGVFIWNEIAKTDLIWMKIAIYTGVGLAIIGAVIARIIIAKSLKNCKLHKVLNNELYVQYHNQSYRWGLWATMLATVVMILTEPSSATLAYMIILFSGVLATCFSRLVYFRSGHERE